MAVEKHLVMTALVKAGESMKKGRVDFATAMGKLGFTSVFDIIRLPKSAFARQLAKYSDASADLAYDNAMAYASLIARLYREHKTSSGQYQALARRSGVRALVPLGPTFPNLFKENWDEFCKVGAIAAIDSPVAYLSALRVFVQQLEATSTDPKRILLDERRPDLKDLLITHESTFTPRPVLEIVNDVLSRNLLSYLGTIEADKSKPINQVLAERRYPFELPYNFYHHQCQLGLSEEKPKLGEVNYRASLLLPIAQAAGNDYGAVQNPALHAQKLLSGLSPQQQALLIQPSLFSNFYLTRSDLADGWGSAGVTYLCPHTPLGTGFLLPSGQESIGVVTPPANVLDSTSVTNLGTVTFSKAGRSNTETLTLAFNTLVPGNLTGKWGLNRLVAPSKDTVFSYLKADAALPSPTEQGYTATFDLITATGPIAKPVNLAAQRFTLTLDEQYSLTPVQKDFFKHAYGVEVAESYDSPLSHLSNLNTFMQHTGLHAEQVEMLLCQRTSAVRLSPNCPSTNLQHAGVEVPGITGKVLPFPQASHYGACYVNGTGAGSYDTQIPATAGSIIRDQFDNSMGLQQVGQGDVKHWQLTKTSLDRFDRLQRMVRLQRWTGIPFAKLDTLLISAIRAEGEANLRMELNENTLRVLGVYRHLNQRHGIDPQEFAALMHDLTPYTSTKNELPLFDQVFNQVQLFDTPLILDQKVFTLTGTDSASEKTLLQLCAGLGLQPTEESLLLIVRQTQKHLTTLKRDLPTISSIYRQARIAQLFGLSVADLLTLAGLFGGVKYKTTLVSGRLSPRTANASPDILDVLMQLDWAVGWLAESEQTVAQLQARLGPNAPLAAAGDEAAVTSTRSYEYPPLPDDLFARLVRLHDETGRSLVTEKQVAALGLPTETDVDAPVRLNWFTLLKNQILDPDGLLNSLDDELSLVDQVPARTKSQVAALLNPIKLSPLVKASCEETLVGFLLGVHDTQIQVLEGLFQETAKLPPELTVGVIHWSGTSVYGVLSQTLESEPGPALIDHFQRISQHAEIALSLRLSNSALRLFLVNPAWLGADQYTDSGGEPPLAELYLLERFSHWLHAQQQPEDSVLSYFSLANPAKSKLKNKSLRRIASETANGALARLLEWPEQEIEILTATLAEGRACSLAQVDWVRRCHATCLASGLSAKALLQATELNDQSSLEDWKLLGDAVMASRSDLTALDAPLNESLRDAMLALYLHEAVPNDAYLKRQGLADQIKTPDDLYEYWLLDVLVTQKVPTSPVACAIASLQQLVNGMMLNMEPGYSDDSLEPGQSKAWRDGLNRYPIWAAIQQLHHFPDIYLDPTLRLTKTDSFKQLENDINQAQIDPGTVQTAVLAYLARFEEIANLKICNGYIDGEDFANSTYYFIGKSPAENAYYWRSLDMSQRPVKNPGQVRGDVPDKFDKPLPNAWSDWKKANVPISEKALEHTIRPCWFNNRLFVIWAEVDIQEADALEPSPTTGRADLAVKVHPKFRLYGSYKKYDDNWSAPRVYIESYCTTPNLISKPPEVIAKETQSISVYDHSTSPESLVLMVYSNYQRDPGGDPDKDKYDFLRTVRIDKNFNATPLFSVDGIAFDVEQGKDASGLEQQGDSRSHVLFIGHLFGKNKNDKANRCQYWLPTGTSEFGAVEEGAPINNEEWNYRGWASRIKISEKDKGLVYNRGNSNIELTVRLNESFSDNITLKMSVKNQEGRELIKVTLVFSPLSLGETWVPLLPGSVIEPVGTAHMNRNNSDYTFINEGYDIRSLIADYNQPTQFSVPATPEGGSAPLTGKTSNIQVLRYLLTGPSLKLKSLWTWTNNKEDSLSLNSTPYIEFDQPSYQLVVMYPSNVRSDKWPESLSEMHLLASSNIVSTLSADAQLNCSFSIDQTSHQPDGWPVDWPEDPSELKIPLIYGVLISQRQIAFLGGALKALSVGWAEVAESDPQIAPGINSVSGISPSLGNAQYVDFTGSSIELSDGYEEGDKEGRRAPVRLNTTFSRHLIELGEVGMEQLLSWETQQLAEPALSRDIGAQPMDFSGAYYLYFLELFLYLPWLVAHRLNEEQQYDEARQWLSYVFDPARQSNSGGHPGYWQAVPLEEPVWPGPSDPSQAILYPDDPHQIALSFPVHFRKALYGLYIDIEGNQADQAYRELTPDGLEEAKLRYVHILDLLGKRPDVRQADDWTPVTLRQLSSARNLELREFEQQLIASPLRLPQQSPLRAGVARASEDAPLLCIRPYGDDPSLAGIDNPYLRRPFNPELIKRWERAESRLYNLRHHLDMAGNALNLPLFAAPLDPRALLAAWGQGLSGAALNRLLNPQIPHYRFNFMFALAQNAVDSVIQFGSTLLSLIERKEQAQFLELQQQQAWNLAKVAVDLQKQAIEIDGKNKEALLASQATIEGRVSYYEQLVNDGLSGLEIAAGGALLAGGAAQAAASVVQIVGEGLKGPPNIIGFSVGGHRLEAPAYAVMAGLQATSTLSYSAGQLMDRAEGFRRRKQEWSHARDQANLEAEQVKAQLAVFEAQNTATRLQLHQAQTALNQARITHDFLLSSNRFSKSQTYDWLNSQFANFYTTAYNTAQSMCQAAEACWQYEMGDFTQSYIRPGAWNSTYRGLGAGEELKMSLQRMHRDYLKNNKRELEIRKTVSLKHLLAKDPASTVNKDWAGIQKQLADSGTCAFELTQAMFDRDYKDQKHYLRRIKTISVTLPVVVGPYQDICAILSQNYSKVEMAATAGTVKENLRVSQQVALSHGVDDNGQFQLNFQDERYLPFEYTGAVSRWSLTFPNHAEQKDMLDSLTDIIVHLSYTARREGGSL